MNAQQPSPNQKRMNALRRRAEVVMPDWALAADGDGTYHVVSDGPDSERVMVIQEGISHESRDFALNVVDDFFFLLRMYDVMAARFLPKPAAQTPSDRSANYAAECAMRCGEQKFREFLNVCHGVDVSDSERIATRIRSMLRIQSRADLNTDTEAASRWRDLVRDYESWERSR